MTSKPDDPQFDRDAVRAKYLEERDKRLVDGRAAIRDLRDGPFAGYRADPFTPYTERDAVSEDVDVAIIGAGMAGLLAAVELRKVGIERICLIDEAGGIGGTWYWNRYPGVMCDIESYTYMPMLEEMDYIPTTRYASGEEIRNHLEAIARRYDLVAGALFHTAAHESAWDEERRRWVIHTDHGDELRARYLVMAVGILNLMKLPAIPGMESFHGASFHTARWDYACTGGGPGGRLDKLSDKVVGILGTGASAIQCIPHLAEAAKHLVVFQRTPSAIGVRGNRPTDEDFSAGLHPGWQRERMENFQALMLGVPVEADLVDDGWTHHFAPLLRFPRDPTWSPGEYGRRVEEFDFQVMEEHRRRIDAIVSDSATAEALKPYYRYLCKRPCFHDEYLSTFNRPNVSLVDCPGGIERITERGIVVDGEEYALDCIVYATGFEAESTPLYRRIGHEVVGREGVTLAQKWANGAASLFGMMTRGFPNLFIMPASGQQAVVTVNYTLVAVEGAEHIGKTVGQLEARGAKVFDVSAEAEAAWGAQILNAFVDSSAFMAACTPSRLNFEGHPEAANPRSGSYGGGLGDFFGFKNTLARWRSGGDFAGLELEM